MVRTVQVGLPAELVEEAVAQYLVGDSPRINAPELRLRRVGGVAYTGVSHAACIHPERLTGSGCSGSCGTGAKFGS